MKVLILAAGYGTRLKEIAENTPKPLLDINGKPLLDYTLKTIADLEDLKEVMVVTNDKFENHFCEWAKKADFSTDIRVINDGTKTPEDRLGSIGDIDFALKQNSVDDDLLVIGGDNLFDFNIQQYMDFSSKKTSNVTIGLYDVGDLEQARLFGIVGLNEQGKIESFEEKPREPKSTLAAMCFYYLPQSTLSLVSQYLEEVKKSDTAGDYIRWLVEKNDVYGFKFTGKWYDIGSVESYKEAQNFCKE